MPPAYERSIKLPKGIKDAIERVLLWKQKPEKPKKQRTRQLRKKKRW